jgi:predicted RNA binding protein YcfA (HicA-like mRNA interferase family)
MGRYAKLLFKILRGASDSDISFSELTALLGRLGFEERIKGSHHIFAREDLPEILNLQPKGKQAKPYQVRQVRELVLKHKLGKDIQ